MSVVILLGDMESVLDPPTEQLKLRGAKISHESGCILKIRENIGNYFCFLLLFLFFFLAWNKRDSFLRCSKMMSRNSIRLIKGQNQIELIYRVNSESLKMKKKSMNLTSSETQTACEQKRSLIHFPVGICYQDDSVKRFLLYRSCCFNDKYFSICSRHYSTIKHKLCY